MVFAVNDYPAIWARMQELRRERALAAAEIARTIRDEDLHSIIGTPLERLREVMRRRGLRPACQK